MQATFPLLLLFLWVPSLANWIEGPAGTIVSSVERQAWTRLTHDAERETFIEQFWAVRDPDPYTRVNEFRQEFESRVAEANRLFGGENASEGWETERGRMYLLLGPPATRTSYKGLGEVRPLELWFYSGNDRYPQLPPFFYILFYQRDEVGDFRRYSPFMHQPRSLIRTTAADNAEAFRILQNIDSELAQASMRLIPGEPIDTDTFTPSMVSDAVLAQINLIPRWEYERIGMLREAIDVKLSYSAGLLPLTVYRFQRDARTYIADFVVDRPAGVRAANLQVVVRREGTEVYRQDLAFPEDGPAVGRLVLEPGAYAVEAEAVDPVSGRSFAAAEAFDLGAASGGIGMSDVLLYRSVQPAGESAAAPTEAPFTYFGYRFTVDPSKRLPVSRKLQVLFQLARPHDSGAGPVSIQYTVASMSNSAARWTYHDEIVGGRFDSSGLLLNSKTLSIPDMKPGRYFLVILAASPSGHRTSKTVAFEVTELNESSLQFRSN